jgi:hypothetical protein
VFVTPSEFTRQALLDKLAAMGVVLRSSRQIDGAEDHRGLIVSDSRVSVY